MDITLQNGGRSISQRPIHFWRLFLLKVSAFTQVYQYLMSILPKKAVQRIGLYRGRMASTFAGSVSLAKKRFTCKISPLYDIRFLSNGLVCPENFKCPSPFHVFKIMGVYWSQNVVYLNFDNMSSKSSYLITMHHKSNLTSNIKIKPSSIITVITWHN